MVPVERALFETMTHLLSAVSIVVVNIEVSSTLPETPPASTKSPTLNGRKVTINTRAAHLPITKTAIADYTLMQYGEALCMMVSRVFSFDFDVDDAI